MWDQFFYCLVFSIFLAFTIAKIQIKIPSKTAINIRLIAIFSTIILIAKSSASWDNRKTSFSNRSIGIVQKFHSVKLLKTILINPPIVIIGTSGTTSKFIKIPVRFVFPIKNNKIGKVPRLAQNVGKPYSLRIFSRNWNQTFLSVFHLSLDRGVVDCSLSVYRSETPIIPINAQKLSKNPRS